MLKTKLPVLIIHDDILLPQNEIKLDFDNNSIQVFRKEHRNDTVYMSDEVSSALLSYINDSRVLKEKVEGQNYDCIYLGNSGILSLLYL